MTNQAAKHELRESQRVRIEGSLDNERNSANVSHDNGAVVLSARDNTLRLVHVTLDDQAIDELMAQLIDCKRCRRSEADPKPARDTWPSVPVAKG